MRRLNSPDWGTPAGNHLYGRGLLIVNADDWGRDRETTDRTLECIDQGAVSSTSAMVFMEDSERAAEIARARNIDAGLHLNFTTAFSGAASRALAEHHRRVSAYLRSWRLAQVFYHPALACSFEYVATAQFEEFGRLYGAQPRRFDGHHHMHLCANVVQQRLLPPGTLIRRNFSFESGEKSFANRLYRGLLDRKLARRHILADFLFALPPLEPASRLQRIVSLARHHTVELETHPVKGDERHFLQAEVPRWIGEHVPVASQFGIPNKS
jgi:chitin disaccharide deacetylase